MSSGVRFYVLSARLVRQFENKGQMFKLKCWVCGKRIRAQQRVASRTNGNKRKLSHGSCYEGTLN